VDDDFVPGVIDDDTWSLEIGARPRDLRVGDRIRARTLGDDVRWFRVTHQQFGGDETWAIDLVPDDGNYTPMWPLPEGELVTASFAPDGGVIVVDYRGGSDEPPEIPTPGARLREVASFGAGSGRRPGRR